MLSRMFFQVLSSFLYLFPPLSLSLYFPALLWQEELVFITLEKHCDYSFEIVFLVNDQNPGVLINKTCKGLQ